MKWRKGKICHAIFCCITSRKKIRSERFVLYFLLPDENFVSLYIRPRYDRSLAGHVAMHVCQFGPKDTAPPCLGSSHRAYIVTKMEQPRYDGDNFEYDCFQKICCTICLLGGRFYVFRVLNFGMNWVPDVLLLSKFFENSSIFRKKCENPSWVIVN